jgi:hypothetical protein
LIHPREPKASSPPILVVGKDRASGSDARQLAVIRKYAPSKALSQSVSRGGINVGEVNALMRRWKPCPDSVD